MPLEEKGMAVRIVELMPSGVNITIGITGQVGVTAMPPVIGSQYTAGFLLSGVSAVASGQAIDSRGYGRGAAWVRMSGNSASATLLISHDSAIWQPVWSAYTGQYTAVCDNWVQVEEYYPYFCAHVEFVSASGGITAAVWMHMTRQG